MNCKVSFIVGLLLFFFFQQALGESNLKRQRLLVAASGDNDIVKQLLKNHVNFQLFQHPDEAIRMASKNDAVLLLAESYPAKRLLLAEKSFKEIRRKKLKVFLEYPATLPGVELSQETKLIKLERGVVTTSLISGLDSLELLGVNDHRFIPLQTSESPLIILGKVAGYDKADYGIQDIEAYPLLFRHQGLLVSSTKLSDAITSRFGPASSWAKVWEFILQDLLPKRNIKLDSWSQDVSPAYTQKQALPENAFEQSILKGADWFYNARLFIHPSWQGVFEERTSKNGIEVVHPPIGTDYPVGDGRLGILEGHASFIQADGSQPYRWWLRADCQAEVAFALSSSANMTGKAEYKETAQNLLHHLYKVSNLRSGERNDAQSPSFGLIGWATTDPDAYYGDDNARALLATIGASANLNTDDWDAYLIEGILGNFRTAGKNGFRGPWFRDAAMQKTDWQTLGSREIVNVHPHYESWLWACYLWLYDKTGYTPLLQKAKDAIAITMRKHPDWKWTNGIQQEYARMLLPLAWLVRVEDAAEHRQWLATVADKLLEDLHESGAIRERLGKEGLGRYGRIASNKEYGSKEAPLISEYGDPATDLLYTLNFASFSLNEAAAATDNPAYKAASNKIADFLVRVQVKSPAHKDLDGAWFRAFDYARWDYWASNADSGWGPWGTLTGWTQSWIINSLILTKDNQNFWDNTSAHYKGNSQFKHLATDKINTMLK
ncbi:hypothetical protein ACMA1I_19895 [Pontibacter sp. 13R65]|uniref:hypothetical protein n=1 Tax=Pontibacter sp. 13R65 TaxID=3127458 RepID=UPI00301BC8AC